MSRLEVLREALAQQRKYEHENWPFEGRQDGESITYHLASLYCWSPDYVLSLPAEKRDERLREIWRSFSIAGDIIKRYEDATEALLKDVPDDVVSSYKAMEAALQLLSGQIINLRTELLLIKALVAKDE